MYKGAIEKVKLIEENESLFQSSLGENWNNIGLSGDSFAIEGKIAFPIFHLSPRYKRGELIEIFFKEYSGVRDTAYIFPLKYIDFKFSTSTEYEALAFCNDVSNEDIGYLSRDIYQFKHDYLIIDEEFYENYYSIFYEKSSELWGGFSHLKNVVEIEDEEFYSSDIIANQINVKTNLQKLEFRKYNKEFSPIYRFLSLYHIFELIFDYDLVEEIKRIGEDYKLIGKKIAEFKNSEYDRLVRLITKIGDENELNELLRNFFEVSQHKEEIYSMLFDYDKSGFPWLYKDQPLKLITFKLEAESGFVKSRFNAAKLNWSLSDLQKGIAFIVYRFRCAIAHASIGEYVISVEEESMVYEKGLPLISGLLNIVLKK